METTKALRKKVRETFKAMPFTEAIYATIEERRALCLIMSETRLNKMCVETSKSAGMYNRKR